MHVRFESVVDGTGIVIVDDIERRRLRFATPGPVEPRPAPVDAFRFPVSAACVVETDYLALDRRDEVVVRSDSGPVGRVSAHEELSLGSGTYSVDLHAPVKVYLRVEGPLTVEAGADYLRFRLDAPRPVTIGARSYHERPAATITTTDDPEDVMTALSYLASALKTTSSERSYPTLRGHPPELGRGSVLDVPDALADARPETGVRIVVPPEFDYVYPIASLAFYLGARIVPGSPPRLTTRSGFEYSLTEDGPFEDAVAGVLQQVVFLDCVVRTEGLYRVDLYEREQVEDALTFDPASLYDRPLGEQIARYLEVPYREIEPYLPRWPLTAHVPPVPSSVEVLPFVVNELGIVRMPRGRRVAGPDGDAGTVDGDRSGASSDQPYVVPDRTDESVDHAWFGASIPLGATKALVRAYRNRLERPAPRDALHITVVCNDERMARETEALDTVYGFRDDFPYAIDSHSLVDRATLRDLLRSGTDFLHFIGDASGEGLDCTDGRVDATALDEVGVETFLLNAPRSAEQGVGLIEAGAVGGVATLGDVARDEAVEIGRGLARLLNFGFPLRPAVELVQRHARSGDRYLVVGDGTVDIAQTSGAPQVCDVRRRDDGNYDLSIEVYPKTDAGRLGSLVAPTIGGVTRQYLAPGRLKRTFTLSRTDLLDYLGAHSFPVRVDGELRWNDPLELPDV